MSERTSELDGASGEGSRCVIASQAVSVKKSARWKSLDRALEVSMVGWVEQESPL